MLAVKASSDAMLAPPPPGGSCEVGRNLALRRVRFLTLVSFNVPAEVGSRIVVLDPKLAKFVEPIGTIIEVRCGGGRVKVEHDGHLVTEDGKL